MKVVLLWASNNSEKYGNKILLDLVGKWHTVYPVNPKESEIEWIKSYKDLGSVDWEYDVVNFVVPPQVTLSILQNNTEILKQKTVWIQPWAESDEIKTFLEKNWFTNYITNSCIMIQTNK